MKHRLRIAINAPVTLGYRHNGFILQYRLSGVKYKTEAVGKHIWEDISYEKCK
jgi:hypothetical protein